MTDLAGAAAADCSTRGLLRRLCQRVLTQSGDVIAAADARAAAARVRQLEDSAHSVLLGFTEAAPPYVPPDERQQRAAEGVAAAATQLQRAGYPSLARDLEAAAQRLGSLHKFALLGSLTEAETGAPLVLPLREPHALLAFLLRLQGSQPSLRHRAFTFQAAGLPADCAAADASISALAAVPLASSVFEEAPNPSALTDGAAAVSVLLPGELGLPTGAYAGSEAVQALAAGLAARPVWAPTAADALPPPPTPSWLPLPPALRELQGDRRLGAPPAPLGLPLSLLSMDNEPGSSTLFSPEAAAWEDASDGDAASADSVQPQGSPGRRAAAARQATAGPPARAPPLWSLGEAELARHVLLALQGVAASLLRLQALLAVPEALPRRSAAGLLRRLAAAAALRQRLQQFVAAFSGSSGDPVQQAFAVAVAEVLRRQAAALQQLEQQESSPWVQAVVTGGVAGRRLSGRGPSLLQVALHTGRLQLQLGSLADVCWCTPGLDADEAEGPEGGSPAAEQLGGSEAACAWHGGSFPAGTELLSYLYRRASEADDADGPMLRFLFGQAIQPYLRHMHAWAFSQHAVTPEFGTAGDRELVTLDFLPPPPPEAQQGRRPAVPLVPADPPAFLQPLHAAFMRAGSQLRLLHSLEPQGRQLAQQLGAIAEQEARQRQALGGGGGAAAAGGEGQPPQLQQEGRHSCTSFSAAPGGAEAAAGSDAAEPWLSLDAPMAAACEASAGSALGAQDLQLSSRGLRQAVEISQERDSARAGAVTAWLAQMALQRRLAEHAAVTEQLGRAAAQRERQAEVAAQQAAALLRRQSSKAALLQEQQAAVAERRARLAAQQAQEAAADRKTQAQAALRQHAAAVAELKLALGQTSLAGGQPRGTAAAAAAGVAPAEPAAAEPQAAGQGAGPAPAPAAAPPQPPVGLPPLKTAKTSRQQRFADEPSAQQENAAPQGAAAGGNAAPAAAGDAQPAAAVKALEQAGGTGAAALEAAAAAAAAEEEAEEAVAPLSAVLEAAVTQSVLSQLFLDQLKILEHLEALRRFFFQGAGDWADAFVCRLGAHADSLAPLASHQVEAMLAEAARGTSVDADPYASHLRVRLLPAATSAITAQAGASCVGAIALATPQRRAHSFWSSRHTVQLAPTQLDALDCVALDYKVGWPLSAILTEDTLQGYAAVFCAMARVRRVEQLLRALHRPLASQPKSTADLLLSEGDADKAHRRIQRLRAFRHGAAQFVASLQAFLQSRTSGDAWVHLLAKLMVSSEEVAAAVMSRQPSASMAGVLGRMNSLGPAGKAAHKLAQHLSRAASGSAPGSPTAVGGGSGPLARFNSLLSAASATSSAAGTPRGGGGGGGAAAAAPSRPGVSRLGSQALGGAGASAAPSAPLSRQQSGWDATAASTGADGLSRQTSLSSVLVAQAAAAAAAGGGAGGPDAAAWARHFQQAQQGIADLQELLDLHRRYVRQASEDCLTFGGSEAVRQAVEGALQCLLGWAFRLQAAVRGGAGRRPADTWTQSLRLDDAWRPLAQGMAEFEARALQLQELLQDVGGKGALAELELDFNSFYQRRRAAAARAADAAAPRRR